MVEINWSDIAKRNFERIINDIKENSLNAAHSFKKRVNEIIENLKLFPRMGRIVPEINNPVYRERIFKNYRIIYKFLENEQLILILTIRHGRRLLEPNGI